ncbi:hypothetical protein LguiA_026276 [Lonicera macranthoides]
MNKELSLLSRTPKCSLILTLSAAARLSPPPPSPSQPPPPAHLRLSRSHFVFHLLVSRPLIHRRIASSSRPPQANALLQAPLPLEACLIFSELEEPRNEVVEEELAQLRAKTKTLEERLQQQDRERERERLE